ncbi:PP2C family protein-serine/threonine phosphatase [Streptomyces sp. HMX87]|uniref:PP2C family protein-serine/threonine phosphatase n=1 Tax=Streptomyces sp. HMX87 TaxID=3390849 RepID=UPI003A855D96
MSPHRRATGLLSYAPEPESIALPRWARWLPVALIVLAVAVELTTSAPVTGNSLLVLSAMMAACVYALPMVVLLAVLNSAAGVLLLFTRHLANDAGHRAADYFALFLLVWVSVPLCALRLSLRRRLAGAAKAAEYAQRAVLPPVRAWLGRTWIAVRYEAASHSAAVGGDLYAAERTRYGVRLLIGDVRGKGLDAIPSVAALVGSFREAAHHTETLPLLARHLDEAVTRYAHDVAAVRAGQGADGGEDVDGERFVTAAVAEIPPGGEEVRLLSRGHCPAFLASEAGVEEWTPADTGLPLGLGELDPGPWEYDSRPFAAGDLLLLCTDGLLEARDADGAFFSPAEGLRAAWRQGPPTVVETLARLVHRHAGGVLADDLALMAVTVAKNPPPSGH